MKQEFLKVTFTADIKKFTTGLNTVSAKMKQVGGQMEAFGRTMSMRVTAPIVAFGAASVKAFGDQEKAEFKLRAALEANGREVDKLFEQYKAFASSLQEVTVVGDETSLAMLQVAENMGLTGDSARRAVKNAIGLSSAFGIAAQSAMRYTAMLEQGDTTMLNRYIPTLRGIEDEAERVSAAHDILAKGFETALAEANTFSGGIQQLRNNFGDFQENVGAVIAEALLPFTDSLNQLSLELKAMTGEQLRSKVAFGAIAAAIPVVTIALGSLIKSVGVLIPALKSLFLLIRTHPIGALATAFGLLGVKLVTGINDIRKFREEYAELVSLTPDDAGERNIARIDLMIQDLTKRIQEFNHAGSGSQFAGFITDDRYEELNDQLSTLIELRAQLTFPETVSEAVIPDEIIPDAPIRPKVEILPPEDEIIMPELELDFDIGFPAGSIGFMNEQIALLQQNMLSATDPTTILQFQKHIEMLQHRIAELTNTTVEQQQATSLLGDLFQQFGDMMASSFANAIIQGNNLLDVLKNIGKMLLSKGLQLLLQGFLFGGTGTIGQIFGKGLLGGVFSVNDALITSAGDVIKFHPDDNILAMKDLSMLGGGQNMNITVTGQLRGEDIFISGTRGGVAYSR